MTILDGLGMGLIVGAAWPLLSEKAMPRKLRGACAVVVLVGLGFVLI